MGAHRFALVAVALACVTAAGAGSYFATRQNLASVATQTASAAPAEASPTAPATSISPTPLIITAPPARAVAAASRPQTTARSAGRPAAPAPAPAAIAPREPQPAPLDAASLPASAPVGPLAPAPLDAIPHTDLAAPMAPPARTFDELTIAAESVIGLQVDGTISSDRARVEDRVEARVSRDVKVGSEVAIPSGTRVLGNVVLVDRGGRMREQARLGIRFHTLLMPDGTRVAIATDPVYRVGETPGNSSAAKIGGGAVAGAILGAIIGGGKGAAIGASTGAGAGTAAVMAGDPRPAVFPAGANVTARITSSFTLSVERE